MGKRSLMENNSQGQEGAMLFWDISDDWDVNLYLLIVRAATLSNIIITGSIKRLYVHLAFHLFPLTEAKSSR